MVQQDFDCRLIIQRYSPSGTNAELLALFDPMTGLPITEVNQYIVEVSPNVESNTLSSYFYALKKFTEYLNAAMYSLECLQDYINQPAIFTLIELYPHYLFGSSIYAKPFFDKVREFTQHKEITKKSLESEVSSVNQFLRASHYVSHIHNQFWSDEFFKLNNFDLHSRLFKSSEASGKQIHNMNNSTVLGAVIRKKNQITNWKYIEIPNSLKYKKSQISKKIKVFPFTRFDDLLKEATIREKLLYVILGGAGLRTHEGLQIRLEDFDQGNLLIRNYKDRIKLDDMDDIELSRFYAAKGRCTEHVFWIPGYEQLFRDLLRLYRPWREEQIKAGGLEDHGFLFVTSHIGKGRPLYSTYRSSHNNTFKRIATSIGCRGFTKHSLRHMYGSYMHYQLPHENGKGLPLERVSKLMGHADITSTQVYAHLTKEVLESLFEHSEKLIHEKIAEKSIKLIGKSQK